MSFAKSLRPKAARLAGLAGLLALPLLAGCAYDDGYYGPSSSYGYGYYGPDYGYGGYGYGYSYGYYGNPCWPYGCDDWRHDRHHRHGWGDGDGDGDNSHHHGNGDANGGRPPGGPTDHAGGSPDRQTQGGIRERSGDTIWILPQRDSKR